jgi:hypothetical protein
VPGTVVVPWVDVVTSGVDVHVVTSGAVVVSTGTVEVPGTLVVTGTVVVSLKSPHLPKEQQEYQAVLLSL